MSRGKKRRRLPAESVPESDMSYPAPLDAAAAFKVLVTHHVDFVIIGAMAVAKHGFVRATKDVDIIPSPEEGNMRKLWEALVELKARPEVLRDFPERDLPVALSLESLTQGANWSLDTIYGRLDILQYIEGALENPEDYARLRANAIASTQDFGILQFVGYNDLVDLKTIAGRDQDLIDLRSLEEARHGRGPVAH